SPAACDAQASPFGSFLSFVCGLLGLRTGSGRETAGAAHGPGSDSAGLEPAALTRDADALAVGDPSDPDADPEPLRRGLRQRALLTRWEAALAGAGCLDAGRTASRMNPAGPW